MDATVTAHMSQAKKEAGDEVLARLGLSASQAINQLYDYLIEHKRSPFATPDRADRSNQLAKAVAWIDGITVDISEEFAGMSDEEIRMNRLRSRGLLEGTG